MDKSTIGWLSVALLLGALIIAGFVLFRDSAPANNDDRILTEENLLREIQRIRREAGGELSHDVALSGEARVISEESAKRDQQDISVTDGKITLSFTEVTPLSNGLVYYDVESFLEANDFYTPFLRSASRIGVGISYFLELEAPGARPVPWVTIIVR